MRNHESHESHESYLSIRVICEIRGDLPYLQQIPFAEKPPLQLSYKGRHLTKSYAPDFVCYDKIILEIIGLLLNFGHHGKLEYERIVG